MHNALVVNDALSRAAVEEDADGESVGHDDPSPVAVAPIEPLQQHQFTCVWLHSLCCTDHTCHSLPSSPRSCPCCSLLAFSLPCCAALNTKRLTETRVSRQFYRYESPKPPTTTPSDSLPLSVSASASPSLPPSLSLPLPLSLHPSFIHSVASMSMPCPGLPLCEESSLFMKKGFHASGVHILSQHVSSSCSTQSPIVTHDHSLHVHTPPRSFEDAVAAGVRDAETAAAAASQARGSDESNDEDGDGKSKKKKKKKTKRAALDHKKYVDVSPAHSHRCLS